MVNFGVRALFEPFEAPERTTRVTSISRVRARAPGSSMVASPSSEKILTITRRAPSGRAPSNESAGFAERNRRARDSLLRRALHDAQEVPFAAAGIARNRLGLRGRRGRGCTGRRRRRLHG